MPMTNTIDKDKPAPAAPKAPKKTDDKPQEIGGSNKPEPTRYGDWEIGGKCVDF